MGGGIVYWNSEAAETALRDLQAGSSRCRRCTLAESRLTVVHGKGKVPALIAMVGEAPGRNEDVQGLPFIGRAGAELDRALRVLGLPRTEIFLTNAVACRPRDNNTPEWACVKACLPRLHGELYLAAPVIIIALGKTAASALIGNEHVSLAGVLGKLVSVTIAGVHTPYEVSMLTTHHPAKLLHTLAESKEEYRRLAREFFSHLCMAKDISTEYARLGGLHGNGKTVRSGQASEDSGEAE